jgi:multidrug efflux system membrane fusion protein
VFLTVEVSVQRGVIAVPTEAVQTGQQGAYVYVVDAASTAKTRTVTTGMQLGDETIVTTGLNSGEKVVIDGQSKLNPGSKVAVVGPGGDTSRSRVAGGSDAGGGTAGGEVSPGTDNGDGTVGAGGRSNGGRANAASGRPGSVSAGAPANGSPNLPPPVPSNQSAAAPGTRTTTTGRPPAGDRR